MAKPSYPIGAIAALALGLCGAALESRADLEYQVIDLRPLGGANSPAYDINSERDVIGSTTWLAHGQRRAYLWRGGVLQELIPLAEGSRTDIGGINALGRVVGHSLVPGQNPRAVYWDQADSPIDLGALLTGAPAPNPSSWAADVNDLGQIVGGRNGRAYLWDASLGTIHLGLLPGGTGSTAIAINAFGHVAGDSNSATAGNRGFLWEDGSLTDLGSLLVGGSSWANDLNDSGHVVGSSETPSGFDRAILWVDGTLTDLGALPCAGFNPSEALAINNSGLVVGASGSNGGCGQRAFRWTNARGMEDLNDLIPSSSGWTLAAAFAVNDAGQIVGFGTNAQGLQERGFLLMPIHRVPSLGPMGIMVMACLLGAAGCWAQRT